MSIEWLRETDRFQIPAQAEAFRSLQLRVENELRRVIGSRREHEQQLLALKADLVEILNSVRHMHTDWWTWKNTTSSSVRVICRRRFCCSWRIARDLIGEELTGIEPSKISQRLEPYKVDCSLVHDGLVEIQGKEFQSYAEGLISIADEQTWRGADLLYRWRESTPRSDDGLHGDILESITDEHLEWFEGVLDRHQEWDLRPQSSGKKPSTVDTDEGGAKMSKKERKPRRRFDEVDAEASAKYLDLRDLGENQTKWAEKLKCDRSLIPRLHAWGKLLEELERKRSRISVSSKTTNPQLMRDILPASSDLSPEHRELLTLMKEQLADGKNGN